MPIVWITGGARRIGKGLALRMAERGFDVGLTYNSSEKEALITAHEIELLGRRCLPLKCNVADPLALEMAITQFESTLGLANVVISNAGIFPSAKAMNQLNIAELEYTLRVNTLPLAVLAKYFYASCKLAGATGRLISIGSLGAEEIWLDRAAYNVSKSALQTLALSLARSCAPVLTVNTVAPGAITQPEDVTESDAFLIDQSRIPMQRHGTIEDIFSAVFFFSSASSYITGQTIVVDGGHRLVS